MKRSSIYLFIMLLMAGCSQYDEVNEAVDSKSTTELTRVYAHKGHNQSEPTTKSASLDKKMMPNGRKLEADQIWRTISTESIN